MYGEFELVSKIRGLAEAQNRGKKILGIGDDCAVISSSEKDLLLTKDLLVEEIHFSFATHTPEDVGCKAIYVNVSDIFAMGGRARYALVGLAAPKETSQERIDGLLEGVLSAAKEFDLCLVGGDTVASRKDIMLSVTLMGECPSGKALLRSGARVGDKIAVTGPLGESAGGLIALSKGRAGFERLKARHRRPRPAPLPPELRNCATAAIDLSDGLSGDLFHICEESKVGARIVAEKIPLSDELKHFCKEENLDPLELALHGGEDFYTVAAYSSPNEINTPEVITIGEICPASCGMILSKNGEDHPLEKKAWDHFRSL